MAAADVPTALAHVCTTMDEVGAALDALGAPHVVKDDGLAAGKGVVVTDSREAAVEHARACLAKPGGSLVVEEFLDGPEVSVFCISDGETVVALAPAQDFKRVGDDDAGPNTGGMGAYSPLDWAPEGLADDIVAAGGPADHRRDAPPRNAFRRGALRRPRPDVARTEGHRVQRALRRPRGQASLARLETPFAQLLLAAATGGLAEFGRLRWSDEHAVVVVVASEGYPASPRTGDPIIGLDAAAEVPGVVVLHAGTALDETGALVSAGGRVLDVVAVAPSLEKARRAAYDAVAVIELDGSHHRTDIALRAERGDITIGDAR